MFKKYLSLVKFSHTIFAMPFAMIGFALGVQALEIPINATTIASKLLYVVLCMVFARNAAMAFNRYLDRRFDALNPRTAVREIPKGIISPKQALLFVIINVLLFFITTYLINPLCFVLAPIAIATILFYSYTKRFTAMCHLILGVGLALAPIGAFLAVTGSWQNSLIPILLSIAVIFWVSGFDIIYSLQDEAFDKSLQLHSIPTLFGKVKALRISELLHFFSTCLMIAVGIIGHFSYVYWIGVALFTGLLVYQHSIVKPNDLSRVNIAFMTSNGIASIVFSLLTIMDIFIIK